MDAAGGEPGRLGPAAFAGIRIVGRLGEGGSSVVDEAEWNGRRVVVKRYKPEALRRHARRSGIALPKYEHDRNLAFFRAPGLAAHVAEPLGFVDEPGAAALVQEKLEGRPYYFRWVDAGRVVEAELFAQVERIVALAHEAGLYDVDLHALNVMVTDGAEGPVARLFDFNFIPAHEPGRRTLAALLARLGLIDARSRDLRKLRDFHDMSRIERRLLRFYR